MGRIGRLGPFLGVTGLGLLVHLYPLLRASDRCAGVSLYSQSLLDVLRLSSTAPVGRTSFAEEAVYYSLQNLSITAEDRAAFAKEGYLVLRGLLPPSTLEALRTALERDFGTADHGHNGWMRGGALLDFLAFGPLGRIAAELLESEAVHLLYSVHHIRQAGMTRNTPTLHYDTIECEDGVLSAAHAKRTGVKFYVPLYDQRPAMWFLNQSSLERMLLGWGQADLVAKFHAGNMPHLWLWNFTAPDMAERVQEVWNKPVLRLGDVIVHTPCLMHRSAAESGDTAKALVLPTYVPPSARYAGRFNLEARQCDSGADQNAAVGAAPRVSEVPRPDCFPRVYPQDALRGRGELQVAIRGNHFAHPAHGYWERWRTALECAQAKPPATEPSPVAGMPLPAPHVKDLQLGGLAAPLAGAVGATQAAASHAEL